MEKNQIASIYEYGKRRTAKDMTEIYRFSILRLQGNDLDISKFIVSLLTNKLPNRQFVELTNNILGNNIDPSFERNHRSLVLELQLLQSGQYLRITFSSASGWSPASFNAQGIHITWPPSSLFSRFSPSFSFVFTDHDACLDLQLFTETLFKHERPPALQVPRVSSLFADGSAALPWGSP